MPGPDCAGADGSSPPAYTGVVRRRWAPPEGRRRCGHGGEAEVAPTRAARLLAFAVDVVAVVVILDTLARLGRDAHGSSPRAGPTGAARLGAAPAMSGHLLGHPPPPASGR